ncbi:hypothetical protein HJC23_011367 [Cyclotella cryptica]|uniref:HSF-type DNA-binding domain-containing protein n=1 Tax=Cyclotella cryptica TaxID=29204 RepID=A0ABD3PRW1_9STRA
MQRPKPKKKRVVRSAFIDHSYHDYADAPNQYPGIVSNATLATDHVNHSVAKNFPAKLHQIVSTPQYHHIIGWLPHGRSWVIRNKELLVSVVLKDHFSHGNFESFNRQVNLWGFKREARSNYHDAKAYEAREANSKPSDRTKVLPDAFSSRSSASELRPDLGGSDWL